MAALLLALAGSAPAQNGGERPPNAPDCNPEEPPPPPPPGNDVLRGGPGKDRLAGGPGRDVVKQ
ncbi:MAG: hypothetical protein H0U65_16065 [Rubrobacter sp.]|nr:hypothetical protein [Rubrobacter sp.]